MNPGKLMIVLGAALIALGLITTFAGKFPGLGRLPGDILIQKKDFTFYFPLGWCIAISVVLTVISMFFGKRW